MAEIISDDDLSSFFAFTGSSDPSVARNYLEMAGNNLEMAVSLFMDHNGGAAAGAGGMMGAAAAGAAAAGSGGGIGAAGFGSPEVRAPDATRTMRLLGGDSPGGGGGRRGGAGGMGMMGGMGGGGFGDPNAALIAAVGGPAAREMMMRNMMGGGVDDDDAMGGMASTWAAASGGGGGSSAGNRRGSGSNNRRARSGSGASNSGRRSNQQRGSSNNDNVDDDDDVQVVDADGQAMDEDNDDDDSHEYNYNDSEDDNDDDDSHDFGDSVGNDNTNTRNAARNATPSLSTMFAPPTHLMHRAGGFMGAKNFAKDARRWLLVNIQSEDDFACHALNRDVWRDELVENLVREGFILWQAMSNSNEGQTYITRYKVRGYPHIAILDPRTGSLIWRKEGWTQVNPLTSEQFVEIASDFCSRHSFDKMPMAARHAYQNGVPLGAAAAAGTSSSANGGTNTNSNNKRPIHELTEEEQLEAAIRASMEEDGGGDDNKDDDDVQVMDGDDDKRNASENDNNAIEEDESKPSAFEKEILSMDVGDEPTSGTVARVQIRMPDGKRLVRKFGGESPVKLIYAFVAQSNEEAKGGRGFELKAKFPPQDLFASIDDSISGCGLNGEAINVIWK